MVLVYNISLCLDNISVKKLSYLLKYHQKIASEVEGRFSNLLNDNMPRYEKNQLRTTAKKILLTSAIGQIVFLWFI